ncbi:hypothetical protein TorRG33x02_067680 [Trema orientale]|uniref:Uncharacterized protein n=1 Tax=Trema orientale TaxID=63057 RepID=A0A2P5FIH2_TREOI|nr:hypothetical protein TorRG33x02_067680 [Trema orientale]
MVGPPLCRQELVFRADFLGKVLDRYVVDHHWSQYVQAQDVRSLVLRRGVIPTFGARVGGFGSMAGRFFSERPLSGAFFVSVPYDPTIITKIREVFILEEKGDLSRDFSHEYSYTHAEGVRYIDFNFDLYS